MAWNYRKRVKLFPGVYLNFSKSGMSTSIGPKGAKVTFGKNGTFLNTSIPGTGLYSRQKIANGNKKRKTRIMSNEKEEQHKEKEGLFSIRNSWGCCFRWFGILSIIFLLVNLIQLIFGYFDCSKDNIDAIRGAGIIAAIFIIVYLSSIIDLISKVLVFFKIKKRKKLTENMSSERTQSQEAVKKALSEAVKKTVEVILDNSIDDPKVETASSPISNTTIQSNEQNKEKQTQIRQVPRIEQK